MGSSMQIIKPLGRVISTLYRTLDEAGLEIQFSFFSHKNKYGNILFSPTTNIIEHCFTQKLTHLTIYVDKQIFVLCGQLHNQK